MGRNPLVALIDGDIILHQAVRLNLVQFEDGDVCHVDAAKESFNSILDAWMRGSKAGSYRICLSDSVNFRKQLVPTYKASRGPKPSGFTEIKEWVLGQYGASVVVEPGLEADDVMGMLLTEPDAKCIAVSIDKDMKTVPGWHFNPKAEERFEVHPEEADLNWMRQTLMGDSTDGYSGVPKIGPAKSSKILHTPAPLPVLWRVVLDTYEAAKLDPKYAVATARLAYILRNGDYDKGTHEVLWREPEPCGRDDLPPEYRRDVPPSRRTTSARPLREDARSGA